MTDKNKKDTQDKTGDKAPAQDKAQALPLPKPGNPLPKPGQLPKPSKQGLPKPSQKGLLPKPTTPVTSTAPVKETGANKTVGTQENLPHLLPKPTKKLPFPEELTFIDPETDTGNSLEDTVSREEQEQAEGKSQSPQGKEAPIENSEDTNRGTEPSPIPDIFQQLKELSWEEEKENNSRENTEEDPTGLAQAYQAEQDLSYEDQVLKTIPLDLILHEAIEKGASDVTIQPGFYIGYQILGDNKIQKQWGIISPEQTKVIVRRKLKNNYQTDLDTNLELDAAYTIDEGPSEGRRCRLAVALTFDEYALKFRIISEKIPTPESLKVPEIFKDWFNYKEGIVMICGSTGTGKTTTIASLLNQIVLNQEKVIYTIEKPIEFIYPSTGLSTITQREVAGITGNLKEVSISADTRSFASALDTAMRWAPDLIMIGEVRNYTEADQLLKASESGHLTVSTMHTNNAVQSIERLARIFKEEERDRVLSSIADSAVGFANQVLLKTPDGNSRFAIQEILEIEDHTRDLIAEYRLREIQAEQIEKKATMEHMLVNAYDSGKATLEEVSKYAKRKQLFKDILEGKR